MRLIDADAVISNIDAECNDLCEVKDKELCEICFWNEAKKLINEVETIDPVKHGHWYMEVESHGIYRCSVCDRISARIIEGTYYCANCGTKMDNEVSE